MKTIRLALWRSFVFCQEWRHKRPNQKFKFRRRNLFVLLIFCSISTLLINFLPNNLLHPFAIESNVAIDSVGEGTIEWSDNEFDPRIARRFKSIGSVVYYVNHHVSDNNNKREKLEVLARIIRKRFHHAFGVYGFQDNWIAALAGSLVWSHLTAKVIPEEIMQEEVAACSQVSIVMMECCSQLGLNTRKVGLVGHYALEAEIEGKWYFVDANLKPNFEAINGRKSVADIVKNSEQFALYANTILDSSMIKEKFSKIEYGEVNEAPAPRAYLFHLVTGFLSHWLWAIILIIAVNINKDWLSNYRIVKKLNKMNKAFLGI